MIEKIKRCFEENRVYYTQHTRQEMREEVTVITEREICQAIENGECIKDYPDDQPYPSMLIFGKSNRPLHVVCAYCEEDDISIVVTTYEPDPEEWIDFKRRRR
jgi:hypothetical protein